MLERFAITPGALSEAYCSSQAALELGLGCLNDLCRAEGLFADLRDGEMSRSAESLSPLAKRFLTHARKEHRLITAVPQLPTSPDGDEEWLWEAQKYHETFPCRAIVTHQTLAKDYPDPPVASIERLNQTDWWEKRSSSRIVRRTTEDYLAALDLVLRHANSLMFIDPHIDPLADNYADFPKLLLAAGAHGRKPLIEIHRTSFRRVQGQNQTQFISKWIADFQAWSDRLAHAGLSATVFLWERMHDRYLITDIVGINVPYGFDKSSDENETTTWSRLGVAERDQIQKEFTQACNAHRLVNHFKIGVT